MPQLTLDALRLEFAVDPTPVAPEKNLVLIHGLGCQMIQWPPGLLRAWRDAGYRILHFDNRDVGLSRLESRSKPRPPGLADLVRWRLGARLPSPYTLSDMAADTLALMDAVEMSRAHILGVSMGGMIAQELALQAPERVNTLSLVMTTSGQRGAGHPRPAVLKALNTPPPAKDKATVVSHLAQQWRLLQGRAYPTAMDALRPVVEACYDRGLNPAGFRRQSAAIFNAADRRPRLRNLDKPTLVLHGDDDPLVDVSGARSLARAIPGAQLEIIPGWGHDFPAALLPRLGDTVLDHLRTAG